MVRDVDQSQRSLYLDGGLIGQRVTISSGVYLTMYLLKSGTPIIYYFNVMQ